MGDPSLFSLVRRQWSWGWYYALVLNRPKNWLDAMIVYDHDHQTGWVEGSVQRLTTQDRYEEISAEEWK